MVMEEQESDMELASESIPVPQVQELIIDAIKRNKSGASRNKPRLRKKALHASILKLMEFYFSDANLSKDRYLSGLLKNNPYVDLNKFIKFNKLSELTTDINRIAKALQGSTMLKVSEDGTKVCRTTPIKKKENVDECTVYVQNLPPDADHEWLESIFSKYGPVDYISIPRYQNNRKIKGFAFVEFDTPTSAQECIKIFRKKGCVLPSYTSPNDLLSITTYDDPKKDHTIVGRINENATEIKLNDNDEEETDKTENNKMDTADNNDRLRKRKFPAEKSFVEEESDVKVKKKRKDGANQNIDRENEKEAALKDEIKDSDDIHNNEKDNNSKQTLKKRKITSGKSVAETEDNDNSYNSEKDTVDNSKQNLRKRKGKSVTETEDNDNSYNNEKDMMDNNSKQNLRKKKLTSEKFVTDKSDTEVNNTANSNIEIEESQIKKIANHNKSPEKKKRRFTMNDTVEDIDKETTKKDSHGLATKSNKNKGKDSEYPNKSDGEHESDVASQTEKHSIMTNVEMKSDVEKESNGNERKKKRNRKKRNKIQEDFDNAIGLQVMAKPEWKHLRNRYLDLQRTKMSQLKQHLRKAEVERGGMMRNRWNYDKAGQNYEKSKYEKDNYDKSKPEKDNGKINEAENSSSGRVSYVPGIIVKIEMDEPCTDPQSFKMEMKDNNCIKYIDITHGSCEAYVRCDTSEAAQSFAQKDYEGRRLMVLKDNEEKSYWDKIARDRAEKLSRKDRKQRGRNKLLKRAEKQLGKCIKFDQD